MGVVFVDRAFESFEPEALLNVVHSSHLEHRLLGAGEVRLRVRNRVGPVLSIDAGDYGCGMYVHGSLDTERLTIGLAPHQEGQVFANGRPLAPHALQVFAEGATVDYVATQAAGWRAVTVTRERLQAHAMRRTGRELSLPSHGCVQFEPDPLLAAQVVDQIEASYVLGQGQRDEAALLCDMALLDALTEALGSAPSTPEPRGARTRRRIMDAVESVACLGAQSADIDAAALSRLCAASERLVEHAMRQAVGMSPKRWLTMARFNRVYAELAQPENTRSITTTAMHWGFMHLGRFASNYRALFGESPSDTVARVRVNAPVSVSERRAAVMR